MKNLLLQNFKNYLVKNKIQNKTFLVAVSGGVDSIVLANLFLKLNYKIGIIHINHNLRGDESELDALFVKNFAIKNQLKFFSKKFDTINFAKKNKIGLQEGARILRYKYFNEIFNKNKFSLIATAHNFNDNAETVFLNLLRGTNLKGLCGIPFKRENIVRPLLFAKRSEILKFANENKILWREDSSNKKNKYSRNLIRNEIFPLIEKKYNITETLNHLSIFANELNFDLQKKIKKIESKIVFKNKNEFKIKIEEILKLNSILRNSIFYNLLIKNKIEPTSKRIENLNLALNLQVGKKIEIGNNFICLRERKFLIISKLKNQPLKSINFNSVGEFNFGDYKILISPTANKKFTKDKNIELVDADKIKFPITIRSWRKNDYFHPIGLNGNKKLSDFLIDEKISLNEKLKIPILVSNNKIVWVCGMRLDDRFKINSDTKNILKLKITKTNE